MGITVVGLGPGDGRLLTRLAWDILSSADTVYLRTGRHPAVDDLPPSVERVVFDHIYEEEETFDDVYARITGVLLQFAQTSDIVYAVPGHPYVGESTMLRLADAAKEAGIPLRVVAGLSFIEPSLTAVAHDALDGLQIADAVELIEYQYPPFNADTPLLLAQVYSRLIAGEVKMRLTAVYPEHHPVQLIHAAGTPDELVEEIPLYAIDRSPHISHLTSLYISPLPHKADLQALAETVAVLRAPGGCPWDQEQTPQSMRSGFLEEASEALDAIDNGDQENLREELGDMLYHIVMQTQMAAEEEIFTLADVIAGIEAKLKRRHPHVWGDWQVSNSDEVLQNWEELKKLEKADDASQSILDGVPVSMPALARSQKIQDKARKVGFDWPDIEGVYAKLQEEVGEIRAASSPAERLDEVGDLLFVAVNLASWLDVDAESALREATQKFSRRFHETERLASSRDQSVQEMDINGLEELWQEAKRRLADN